ncbi:DUF87 domain-containing protein [Haloarculaceae archaeon H-GB2-1]|nr:DUF87 domain-containing protein [Haloarculaceae archaeon H-GB1-1]MEA5387406.1 DUF87 domain-containing protein [Haloarculaceae archaeon H-GB11]MEA5408878.1 DUF87 domain-containing protein [Haloarculaceae archaeon H-GB2-1]
MGGRETISVAEVSEGKGGTGTPGDPVDLPVVEVLTGRAFITGKSGSGKSNTASVVIEKLLDASFPVLIVDIDGEYYGLKEKYEILHVGDDEECDIQVNPEHAEKIASLALEENVPIILDVSSFLDEDESKELLTAVARQLFAKEKKLKKPFLMIVEEIHEYLPEGAGLDECGKMLIKIGKRGRKHGLGIAGISQRPADVKKDFITQCDWLVWHRLTWNNDTKVVRRVLDGEYASAVEDLDDGEGFMMTDWSETVRRVQFHRKQTFDAGATPGLDDFERPELKSVSEDLVSELQTISEEEQAHEDRIKELREELDKKNSRIAELETELQDARDLQRMAEQFTQALLSHVEGNNPGWTEQERMRNGHVQRRLDAPEMTTDGAGVAAGPQPADSGTEDAASPSEETETAEATIRNDDGAMEMATAVADAAESESEDGDVTETDDAADTDEEGAAESAGDDASESGADDEAESADDDAVDFAVEDAAEFDGEQSTEPDHGGSDSDTAEDDATILDDSATDPEADDETLAPFAEGDAEIIDAEAAADDASETASTDYDEFGFSSGDAPGTSGSGFDDIPFEEDLDEESPEPKPDPKPIEEVSFGDISRGLAGERDSPEYDTVRDVRAEITSLDGKTRQMLRFYRDQGPGTPMEAHFSSGGSNDRTDAYARNRQLRIRGFVEHVGRGRYEYTLPDLVGSVADDDATNALDRLERTVLSTDDA